MHQTTWEPYHNKRKDKKQKKIFTPKLNFNVHRRSFMFSIPDYKFLDKFYFRPKKNIVVSGNMDKKLGRLG